MCRRTRSLIAQTRGAQNRFGSRVALSDVVPASMTQNPVKGGEPCSKRWSIIIPAFNEEEHIHICLESVCGLIRGEHRLEVVVVDNGSTDRTVAIALSYSGRVTLRVLEMPSARIGALRNAGAETATGEFLVFLDADCLLTPLWLECASTVLEGHPATVAGAYYAMPPDAGWPARIWHQRFHAGRQGPVSYLPGGNLVMERRLFGKLGGFDPHLRSNEDSQFCSRARAVGIPVIAFPELAAVHLGAEKTLLQFIKRQIWHGSNVLNQLGFRGNARAVGLAAYTFFCLVCALIALLSGQFAALVAAVGVLSVPPVLTSLRGPRLKARIGKVPLLIILLTVYAVVRACVLPRALFESFQQRTIARAEPQLK